MFSWGISSICQREFRSDNLTFLARDVEDTHRTVALPVRRPLVRQGKNDVFEVNERSLSNNESFASDVGLFVGVDSGEDSGGQRYQADGVFSKEIKKTLQIALFGLVIMAFGHWICIGSDD
jgi:hypothetical protein